ncbi:MAG: succinylglutamate desuccinylase/aspartoacylase family protein [Planctomycetes bacterium]|nr:succinylglutamate desuccinylase/aspartoacylase family protein [Planctomycetota bacterium]MCB9917855.1 succinylglutamate desuccinylase/aspartoacylase family protein [Planctomycetota bacterium]
MSEKRRRRETTHLRTGFWIGNTEVAPGSIVDIELEMARLPTRGPMTLPVRVFRGRIEGPKIWLSAAIHGDELSGIEIIRRALEGIDVHSLRGTVIAVPIVNVHGFLNRTRALPDGRDLNRSFPGSRRGSLTARLAWLFMSEIASKCDYGLDFHTATSDRINLPQVRADLSDPQTRDLAEAFGAPVTIDARTRDGSLREVATKRGARVLLFEGGEAQRFDEASIAAGVDGVHRVLEYLGMHGHHRRKAGRIRMRYIATGSSWVRAPRSGLFRSAVHNGERVSVGDELGVIANAFGDDAILVRSKLAGVIVSMALNPVVHQGDALVHVAFVEE